MQIAAVDRRDLEQHQELILGQNQEIRPDRGQRPDNRDNGRNVGDQGKLRVRFRCLIDDRLGRGRPKSWIGPAQRGSKVWQTRRDRGSQVLHSAIVV